MANMLKKYILHIVAAVSILLNIILVCYICFSKSDSKSSAVDKDTELFENTEQRDEAARKCVRKFVCQSLYYPESYDPVLIQVDSAFYGPLTDPECVKAALELIELRRQLGSAESQLQQAKHDIEVFGSSGVFWHHAEDKKDAEAKISELTPKIERRQKVIKDRNTVQDGAFIGWVISHRYRASNRNGGVAFANAVFVVDPKMENLLFQYSADENDTNNIENISKVIQQELGTYVEE